MKKILLVIFCIWSTPSVFAQTCKLDLSQLSYLNKQEKYYSLGFYEPGRNVPVSQDENYQVFYIGFGDDKGDKTLSDFHNPKYVFLSDKTCQVTKVIDLKQGRAEFPQNAILISRKSGGVIVSSLWMEQLESESGATNSETQQDVSIYDYNNLKLLKKRRYNNAVAVLPGIFSSGQFIYSQDGRYLYLVKGGDIQKIYIFDLENGEFVSKTLMDAKDISDMGIKEYFGFSFKNDAKMELGDGDYWNDFEDVPTIALLGNNEEIHYKLNGDPLFVVRWGNDKMFVGSPEQFAKSYGIAIKPLKFVPVSEEEKGVLIAGELLKQVNDY